MDMDGRQKERLGELIAEMPACEIRPREFFIAWHGVPALAFTGFPPPIAALKRKLEQVFPDLAAENSGSRWPKTTLGAPREHGPPISPAVLSTLRDLCDDANGRLREAPPWKIDSLQYIALACRSLERIRERRVMPAGSPEKDQAQAPDAEEVGRVDVIMNEFARENLDEYLSAVTRAGGTIADYRAEHHTSTLAFFPPTVPDYIRKFRDSVNDALPEHFGWFADDALHITLRTLRLNE